jgi:hypothetical protein
MRSPAVRAALLIATLAGACLVESVAAMAADACSILSQTEVGALLGTPVNPGEPRGSRACVWHEQDLKLWRNLHLSFLSPAEFATAKSLNSPTPKTHEGGLGDEAVFIHPPGVIFNLVVKKGGTYFRVQARSNPQIGKNTTAMDLKDQELDRAIAHAVLKKL